MFNKVLLCALLGLAAAQHAPLDDGDDGSYNAEKYEVPYQNEVSSPQQQQYRPQPQYQPQAQYQSQPQYRPQPQYQPQPQYNPPQPAFRPQSSYNKPTSDHRNAAILTEQRYLSGDGKFGASYTQDDGVEFKEESDPDGTRRGTYSYVDPSGQRRTVSYTAGKNGFQASGDHLPVASAPAAPQPQYSAPQQQYRAPQPQYSAPQQQYRPQASYSQAQPQYSQPQPQYSRPQEQYRSQAASAPASSDGGYTINANF